MAELLGQSRGATAAAIKAPLREVLWTDFALKNLRAIRIYIGQFNPAAARVLAEQLVAAGNSPANFPHRERPLGNTRFRELVTVHPYIIRYRIHGDTVVILRIRHTARRPIKL